MTICILTPRFPFPENGGDVLRINNIARHLKREGHRLVLVSLCDHEHPDTVAAGQLYDAIHIVPHHWRTAAWGSLTHLLRGKPIQCGFYHSRAFVRRLREVVSYEHPDLYIAHLLRMSPYLERLGVEAQSIVEMTDALSKTYNLCRDVKGIGIKPLIYRIERRLIKRYEKHVSETFPKVVLVSPADIDYLKTFVSSAESLTLHTNGVDCPTLPCDIVTDNNKLVFIGNMRTLQNQDAVQFFVQEVLPRLLPKYPQLRLYVVGAQPPKAIQDLTNEHVIVTGFVDDLNATIRDAAVAVAPVRIAAGIQNKVLVAMSQNLPVVMTSLIACPIPQLRDGENVLIRDTAADIAAAIDQLLTDKSLRQRIADSGHTMVEQHYSWSEKLKGIETLNQ